MPQGRSVSRVTANTIASDLILSSDSFFGELINPASVAAVNTNSVSKRKSDRKLATIPAAIPVSNAVRVEGLMVVSI